MSIKKMKTKSIKSSTDVADVAVVGLTDSDTSLNGETTVQEEVLDIPYVRDSIKCLIEYLAKFEGNLARETAGNLAYIYLDLTDDLK